MKAEDYQNEIVAYSKKGYSFFGTEKALIVYQCGLPGEVGEVCELLKRFHRGEENPNFKEELKKELGDTLNYAILIGSYFEISLEEIMQASLEKLKKREEKGNFYGTGGDR